MGVFREQFGGFRRSPSREIYGLKNGLLVVPIDICILEIDNGGAVNFNPPAASTNLIGAAVKLTAGATLGKVKNFQPPSITTNVNPIVTVEADHSVQISSGTPSSAVDPTAVSVGDLVTLKIDNVQIPGEVKDTDQQRTYLLPTLKVQAFLVDFNQILLDRVHGARVVHNNTNQLLGMLIATQNQNNGICQTLVYPAKLI